MCGRCQDTTTLCRLWRGAEEIEEIEEMGEMEEMKSRQRSLYSQRQRQKKAGQAVLRREAKQRARTQSSVFAFVLNDAIMHDR